MNDERVFVGLGANLGDARATLMQALKGMAALPGTRQVAVSSFYRSAPFQAEGPPYVNAVAELRTSLEPAELLHALQGIEAAHGRQRPYRNAPRTLDLDLLLYGDRTMATAELTLPHPRMQERVFVLQPLAEIDASLALAGQGLVGALAASLAGQSIERLP